MSNEIKAKITVGKSWVISLDVVPVFDLGTPAPIGTIAEVNESGVGSAWLKTGPLDTDWTQLNGGGGGGTGWNFAASIPELNTAGEDRYFGTNADSSDSNIIFVRRGDVFLQFLKTNRIVAKRNFSVDLGNDRSVEVTDYTITFSRTDINQAVQMRMQGTGFIIQFTSAGTKPAYLNLEDGIATLDSSAGLTTIQGNVVRQIREAVGNYSYTSDTQNNVFNVEKNVKYINDLISNGGLLRVVPRPQSYDLTSLSKVTLIIAIKGSVDGVITDVAKAVVKKEFLISDSTIIDEQTSYLAQNDKSLLANFNVSMVSYTQAQFVLSLKTLELGKTIENTTIVIQSSEINLIS